MLSNRENLLRAMRRQDCERIPFQFSLCDSLMEKMRNDYGTDDYVQKFDMPVQYVTLPQGEINPIYRTYHKNYDELSFIDEWGVGHKRGSIAHFTHFYSPMADFTDPEQVLEYPYPDMTAEWKWAKVREQVEKAHSEGRAAAFFAVQVFEPAWYLRGLDNLLADFLVDEEMAEACMTKMTDIQCEITRRATLAGCDIIIFGDDVGTQRALMMSRPTWETWCRTATKATIDAAKNVNRDVLAFYHSDGNIEEIIGDLIDIGVDILNPIQPECMDIEMIKQTYGDRLSFWGGIGTQTTMPFGTADEVYEKTRDVIGILGKDYGFCVAPSHMIEPEVPWENLMSFLKAVDDFGKY